MKTENGKGSSEGSEKKKNEPIKGVSYALMKEEIRSRIVIHKPNITKVHGNSADETIYELTEEFLKKLNGYKPLQTACAHYLERIPKDVGTLIGLHANYKMFGKFNPSEGEDDLDSSSENPISSQPAISERNVTEIR